MLFSVLREIAPMSGPVQQTLSFVAAKPRIDAPVKPGVPTSVTKQSSDLKRSHSEVSDVSMGGNRAKTAVIGVEEESRPTVVSSACLPCSRNCCETMLSYYPLL